jgi:hypothetical protein
LLQFAIAADNAAMQTEPPKADPPKRKRRRFQFRLRTLMIGVTVLAVACGYVGWQESIVRERKELLSFVVNNGGGYLFPEPDLPSDRPIGVLPAFALVPPNRPLITLSTHNVTKNPQWIRIWLGDERIAALLLTASVSSDDAARIIAAFPEANVSQYTR